MNKDVLLRISGVHINPGDSDDGDDIELITPASYYRRNGKHYILYDETQDDGSVVQNRVKFNEDVVEVVKGGAVSTCLVFDPKQKNTTVYETPFGTISMGVTAKRISLKEEETLIHMDMDYILDVNLVPFASCTLNLDVVDRKNGGFSLTN